MNSLFQRAWRDLPLLGVVVAPPVLLLAAVQLQPWASPEILLRDTVTSAALDENCCTYYTGAVSNLGVVLWGMAASVALFGAALMDRGVAAGRRRRLFLCATAAISLIFMLDDLFLLHEDVLPYRGVPEIVTYGAYALMMLGYGAVFARDILATRFLLAAATALFFMISTGWDVVLEDLDLIVVEDGAKFVGICCWAGFAALAAYDAVLSRKNL
ncbi:hypothetical protein [Hyphococcus sp.]|uniref:hypothetical protein n=1 Tax=Hyphococcus sp. TaxID=2038636 RepID=UPI003CCBE1D8